MRQTIRRQFQFDFISQEFDIKQRCIGNTKTAGNVILACQYLVNHSKALFDDLATTCLDSRVLRFIACVIGCCEDAGVALPVNSCGNIVVPEQRNKC